MAYADYTYYKKTYLGTSVPETDFPRLALRASEQMASDTFGRAGENAGLGAVKNCCCAVADVLYREERQAIKGGFVQSESVGGQSRTYALTQAELASIDRKCLAIERRYLMALGLLYRGCD